MINGAKVICLCGSTRFTYEMLIRQWELTKQGCVVLGWCALPDDYFQGEDKTHIGDKEGVKSIVDEVHKRKIDLCDEVVVIHAGLATNGLTYIGESTYGEMAYAFSTKKPVQFYPPNQVLQDNWNYEDWRRYIGQPIKPDEVIAQNAWAENKASCPNRLAPILSAQKLLPCLWQSFETSVVVCTQ